MNLDYPSGATLLEPDEIEGLIPTHILTQAELNEWEAANILKAETWAFAAVQREIFLTIQFIRRLHKKMFDNTWRWAGKFRGSNKNIGTDYPLITTSLRNLLDDVMYQIMNQIFSLDEIAYRFHHRLVAIHPFSNGNGRHARIMTDLLLVKGGRPRFSWGRKRLGPASLIRDQYITALKEADKQNYILLEKFVRT